MVDGEDSDLRKGSMISQLPRVVFGFSHSSLVLALLSTQGLMVFNDWIMLSPLLSHMASRCAILSSSSPRPSIAKYILETC